MRGLVLCGNLLKIRFTVLLLPASLGIRRTLTLLLYKDEIESFKVILLYTFLDFLGGVLVLETLLLDLDLLS
jgi:hypothetical protein